jgi:curli production assembly/transport component CsgF
MKVVKLFAIFVTCLFVASTSLATELIHTPINPSFVGGNAFNGSYLLNSAAMQNKHKEKVTQQTALEQFEESLQRNLLYAVTSKLTQEMYGEGGFKPGHYSYAGMDVDVVGGTDGVTITIPTQRTVARQPLRFRTFNVEGVMR